MKTYTVEINEHDTKRWYFDDKLHCEHGPAVEYADGSKEWWLNGKRNRTDGPAAEFADGSKYWYLNGERLTEAEFLKRTKPNCMEDKFVEIDGVKYKLVRA